MTRFFVSPEEMGESFLVLTGENAAHAKVLRLKTGDMVTVCVNETLPCHFPLRVDFVLRSFLAFEIIGVMVFFLFIQVAVILYQLTQPFFYLCPRKNKVGVCR